MFKGAAWFSPSVPRHVRRQWVTNGGKKAGRGPDHIRRRLWYCFCNGLQDPKLDDVRARGLIAYHALWIADCIKVQRILPMDGYILDPNYPDEALDIILSSPKRRSRPLGPDSSFSSSVRTPSSIRRKYHSSAFSSPSQHRDYSVDRDVDLEDVFSTPGRVGYTTLDPESSSSLSWDVTPSLTFEQEVDVDEDANDDIDQSRVEELVDTEMGDVEEENGTDWHRMKHNSRYT
ncbi:hypothetical protein FRC12_021653 [Ceratobasidium sp. 428]|nr:hypothetical protein FRC12_021653 [Ceratobasidium sp. 428]